MFRERSSASEVVEARIVGEANLSLEGQMCFRKGALQPWGVYIEYIDQNVPPWVLTDSAAEFLLAVVRAQN